MESLSPPRISLNPLSPCEFVVPVGGWEGVNLWMGSSGRSDMKSLKEDVL